MGKKFFLIQQSFKISGNELRIELICHCGKTDVMRFTAKDLAYGGTYTCTTCGNSLKLTGLSWDQRLIKI